MIVDTADLLDVRGVAQLAGLTESTVRGYASRGYLPAPVLQLAGGPIWHRPAIVAWRANRPGRGKGGGRPRKTPPPATPITAYPAVAEMVARAQRDAEAS